MLEIKSQTNEFITTVKSLQTKKGRQQTGLFFVEGMRFTYEMLKSKLQVKRVIISESFYKRDFKEFVRSSGGLDDEIIVKVPDNIFEKISDTVTPQGIMAVAEKIPELLLKDVLKKQGLYLFCDRLQDPGNLGTIIRSCDAAGVDCVFLNSGCVDIYSPKVLRSTMGSVFRMAFIETGDELEFLSVIKKAGIYIYTASGETDTLIYDVDLKKGTLVVIGNEASGVDPAIKKASDKIIKIPMKEGIESLNAATAASVTLFEAMRQRMY